jgi:putative copper resistance protein D
MTTGTAARPAARVGGPRVATTLLVAVLPVGLLVVTAVLVATGGAAAPLLGDPGPVVRWGQPLARVVQDVSAAVSVGALLLAACVLPERGTAFAAALRLALPATVVWAVAASVAMVTGAAQVFGTSPATPGFGSLLARWLVEVDGGRLALVAALMAGAVATVAAAVRTPVGSGVAGALGVAALVPVALGGHSGSAASHDVATTSLWLHLVGICVWFGGLAALALLSGHLVSRGGGSGDSSGRVVVARFSSLAGWGFALVALSGLVNAWTRIGTPSALATTYGLLVVAKTVALVLLGVAGWVHRRSTISPARGNGAGAGIARAAFWRLVGVELVVMAVATGLAVALARTPPPVPETAPPAPTPAQVWTGEPLPPPLTADSWLTQWSPDVLWLLVAAVAVGVYLRGVAVLRRRGDAWPVHRTLLWVLGWALVAYVTSGGPAAYGRVLFSAHMVQHMTMAMGVPALLVFGAPVTLAARALARRRDTSRGPREWLLGLVESRPAQLLAHPVVAAAVFTGSLVVFYFTPLFGIALRTHVGHELMMVHFLLTGYLFAQGLVGIDPGPARPPYPFRLVLLFATMAFHAFFGVALTSGDTLLQATWFSQLGWGIDLLADQQRGGGIAWGIGELPTLLLALAVAVQWSRADARESTRGDRAADRDGDADLARYNDMLARMGGRPPD